MGVRILLMGLDRWPVGGSEEQPAGAETLCVSNTFVPLFWLLPYRHSDLQLLKLDDVSGSYPVLVARREDMLERLERSVEPVAGLLGEKALPLLQQWRDYLGSLAAPVIALETYELWAAFADKQGLKDQLLDQLEALEHLVSTGHLSEPLNAALLEPSNLLLPGSSKLCLDDISLAGFGWREY